jgi:hypothetical protein
MKTPSQFPDERGEGSPSGLPGHPSAETRSRYGRAIRHIEHYANKSDLLSRLGCSKTPLAPIPRAEAVSQEVFLKDRQWTATYFVTITLTKCFRCRGVKR